MQARLRFLGAARNVTGSRHLLEFEDTRILVDCGLYQERQFRSRNWDPFVVPPASIQAVLLTHAHLDHCGLLPKLVKEGFKGKIHCTEATAEIAKIILLDAGHLQEEDAAYKRKRHEKQGRDTSKDVPLYTMADAEACFPLFAPVRYGQEIGIRSGVKATFHEAGHVLGSSFIDVRYSKNGQTRNVLFSGDMGRADRPILRDPESAKEADYLLVESTYGDRVHEPTEAIKPKIAEIINATKAAGGNIIVPSFALERAQELLYFISELIVEKAIPHVMVFLDSPMAGSITKVFRHHPELFDKDMQRFVRRNGSPFDFADLKITQSTDESKAINQIKGTVVVIAGSGMCTGGRIKHHLVNNISRPESTIMFVGYQAIGTLGRRIVNGEKEVRILGSNRSVQARIAQVHGFSAHADREELLTWLQTLKRPPRKLFVVHGEAESAQQFGRFVREETGWEVVVPDYQDEAILD